MTTIKSSKAGQWATQRGEVTTLADLGAGVSKRQAEGVPAGMPIQFVGKEPKEWGFLTVFAILSVATFGAAVLGYFMPSIISFFRSVT